MDAPATDIVSDSNQQLSDIGHAIGLEMHSDIKRDQHALERLIEWANMRGAKDSNEIISHIKELANRVGAGIVPGKR